MIELQRARLLAAKGSKSGASPSTSSQQIVQTTSSARTALSGRPTSAVRGTSAQQLAATSALSDDAEMSLFFEMLQNDRDDNRADSSSGPTVPTALSRRMLQRQGVGYLDSTVAVLASAMSDRFLATMIQQSIVCRDHRLKGSEFARETERYRKRHQRLYRESVNGRVQRKITKLQKREMSNLAIVQVAETVKSKVALSKDASRDGDINSKSKKKKKTTSFSEPSVPPSNAILHSSIRENDSDDAASFDSIDEEEDYYVRCYSDANMIDSCTEDEEDEEEEMIILRDFERSLEVWNFSVSGKKGVDPVADHVSQRQGVGTFIDEDDEASYNMSEFDNNELYSNSDLDPRTPSDSLKKTESSPLPSSARNTK